MARAWLQPRVAHSHTSTGVCTSMISQTVRPSSSEEGYKPGSLLSPREPGIFKGIIYINTLDVNGVTKYHSGVV